MKIVQINAVFGINSTGTTTMQMHDHLLDMGIESYVVSPSFESEISEERAFQIGNYADRKIHALLSRLTGKQAWYSKTSTKKMIYWLDKLNPDVVVLHNLHSNYINLPMLLRFLANRHITTFLVLHDSWLYTGGCVYYVEHNCSKWERGCGNCPALRSGNKSWFFDRSKYILRTKKVLFSKLERLYVIGVSKWIANEAKRSIIGEAQKNTHVYNWIDTKVFYPRETTLRNNLLGREFRHIALSAAWTWNNSKGLSDLIKLAEIDDTNTIFVLMGKLDNRVHLPSNMVNIGRITDQSLQAEYYTCADVFLHLSVQETFGKVTAEAIACGTPAIVYNSTASPELITESTGRVVEVGNILEINRTMKEIYSIESDYFRRECLKFASYNFDQKRNISMYIELFLEAIGEGKLNG